jgi:hypothetical protein
MVTIRFPENFGRNYRNADQDFRETSIREISFREIVGKLSDKGKELVCVVFGM